MKKIAAIFVLLIVAYSVYYDLTKGTLTIDNAATAASSNPDVPHEQSLSMPYETIKTTTGDTVISIAETIHDGPLPVSIEQLIGDFQKLNHGIQPDEIQRDTEYKFPVYSR
ncbi:hypothetical protein ACFSCZ_01450 [Siminovitchia sediminis]|uniref:LysM domain-containing protein n=1 Tax=Siminovitchia sediminis TaxID=1274353 RepID=A0ABW4KGW6_9BACI